jgi:amino acid transporter
MDSPSTNTPGKSILDILFGRPLANFEDRGESVGIANGIPIFGLDALSSAAYGPEAALTILIPLGLAGIAYIVPISVSIIVLLTIVYISYRQTIEAYPQGGGSYTVATENLGIHAGLLAAAALMIDYILCVAVGISAGVGALVSAVPSLQPHTLLLCLGILLLLTLINLRGVREAGAVFMAPTYLFVGCMMVVILLGVYQSILHHGHPVSAVALPPTPPAIAALSVWLLLKAFASGCTAMTGVEAVSNGVGAFREPRSRTAQKTLTVIILLLIVMLAGIAGLIHTFGITATTPGEPGYQSTLSLLTLAVSGRNWFYYVTIGSILAVLALSANTAFADFPRLCKAIAARRYLPSPFTEKGRRLVYSWGVWVLFSLAGLLLIIFRGVTDRLIPLFAVGAFLAFTLSQAGMVVHWNKHPGPHARTHMLVNGFGAIATGITVCVVLAAKFMEGAWIVVLLMPALIAVMLAVKRHYRRVTREIARHAPLRLEGLKPPIVVVPVEAWNRVTEKALRYALSLSKDIQAVHIDCGEETIDLRQNWSRFVEQPIFEAGLQPPELVILESPYRSIITPILNHVLQLEKDNPGRIISIIIPELVENRWYYYLLHNQRAAALKGLLYFKGDRRIVVANVPWYLDNEDREPC